ncbi:MAG: sigma factor-like helix-turn-helix DNA-binding protein [Actinomycetota bacterium]
MERDEAVEQLPVTYQQVLAWLEDGRSRDEIAARLGVELTSVEPLVRLAEAKLARLTADLSGATTRSPPSDRGEGHLRAGSSGPRG